MKELRFDLLISSCRRQLSSTWLPSFAAPWPSPLVFFAALLFPFALESQRAPETFAFTVHFINSIFLFLLLIHQ